MRLVVRRESLRRMLRWIQRALFAARARRWPIAGSFWRTPGFSREIERLPTRAAATGVADRKTLPDFAEKVAAGREGRPDWPHQDSASGPVGDGHRRNQRENPAGARLAIFPARHFQDSRATSVFPGTATHFSSRSRISGRTTSLPSLR